MQEKKAAVWEQLQISQISSGATLHAPLHILGAILHAARFRLPFAFANSPIGIILYFAEVVQDREDSLGGITLLH